MRIVKKPETRKREILTGALAVFLRKGYEQTAISDIAQEVGISQGLCYRYFASKEEIYEAVIDTYGAMIAEQNLQNRTRNRSIRQWVDSIPGMLSAMKQAEKESPERYALFHDVKNEKMHRELCLKVGERLIPVVSQVLEQAKQQGEIRVADCHQTAIFGIYGEIGLILSMGDGCGNAIQEQWRRLLEI